MNDRARTVTAETLLAVDEVIPLNEAICTVKSAAFPRWSIQATLSHDGLSITTCASRTPSRPWNPEQPVALPPYKDDEQRGHVDTRTGGIEAMSPPTLASILSSPIWLLPWI